MKRESRQVITATRRPALIALIGVLLLFAVISGTMAFLIARTSPVRNQFVNGLPPVGSLSIHKSVSHPFGAEYIVPDNNNTTFTFKVDLGQEHAGESFGDYTADSSGVVTLRVKAGESAGLTDLPAGLTVTVSEADGNAGFGVQAPKTVTIVKDEIVSVSFDNPYTPAPAYNQITVKGEKHLTGRDWLPDDRFVFSLDYRENGEWKKIGEYVLTPLFDEEGKLIEESVKFDLTPCLQGIVLDHAGAYSFRLSETEGTIGGILYDPAVSYFDVFVTDADMDGKLELSRVTTGSEQNTVVDGFSVYVVFENRYAPEGSVEVLIPIRKVLQDNSGAGRSPAGFVFELYDENGALVAASGASDREGSAMIRLVYEPDDAGKTFYYVLKERLGDEPGMDYDETEYFLRVTVTDNLDGTISAVLEQVDELGDGRDQQPEEPNTDPDEPEETEPVTDPAMADPDDTEETGDKPEETQAPVETEAEETPDEPAETGEENTENVQETESPAPVETEAPVVETEPAEPVETEPVEEPAPQETEAPATEPVEGPVETEPADTDEDYHAGGAGLPGNAKLRKPVVHLAEKRFDEEEAFEFVNVYTPEPASAAFSGTKELEGRTLKDGEFSFVLYKADSGFEKIGDPLQTVKNDRYGDFSFTAVKFDRIGTYYFLVEELAGSEKGVSYDPVQYQITVTVTDRNGTLKAAVELGSSFGRADSLVFKNSYQPESVAVVFSGEKVLSGMGLDAGQFSFDLYAVNETGERDATPLQTVENDAEGVFEFREIRFYTEGVWTFAVRENGKNGLPGVRYDDTEYLVSVTVKDNGSGNLVAETGITTDAGEADRLLFRNVYSATFANVELRAQKVLKNGTLKADQFSFLLYCANDDFTELLDIQTETKNLADGTVSFGTLTFTKPGVYRFVMMEDLSSKAEVVIYDDSVYFVIVTVTDDGKGKLVAETELLNAEGDPVRNVTFVNTMKQQTTPVTPEPTKPHNPVTPPKTGDENDPVLWYWIFGISTAGLAAVVAIYVRLRKKQK